MSRLAQYGISVALSISEHVEAVTVVRSGAGEESERVRELQRQWTCWNPGLPLRVLRTEYASVARPIVAFVDRRVSPEPARDEILAAGVGPWDVEQRRGGWSGPLPYIPGREFAGLVVGDTGADAGFEDGTPVYGWPGPGGCYAQYVTCDVERLALSRPGCASPTRRRCRSTP